MNRRDFMKTAGCATAVAAAYMLLPTVSHASPVFSASHQVPGFRYMIHGNKRLGCSGCDFPADPEILENGHFMPQM